METDKVIPSKIGYIDITDYHFHIQNDRFGATIYPSVETLLAQSECAKSCGIYEVEIKVVKVAMEPNK